MLDASQLDHAEKRGIELSASILEGLSVDSRDTRLLSLLSAMYVRGWMAAVIYLEGKREKE